jgi:bifunctional non-homologous end joining protein LigD
MLAGATGLPANRTGWLIEPKWDGVRAIVTVDDGTARFHSRNGNDVTASYPELATPPDTVGRAVLDAEIVALGDNGAPSFGRLQQRMHVRNPAPALVQAVPASLIVFDVLWLDGVSLLDQPHTARRQRLDDLAIRTDSWVTSPLLDLPIGPDLLQLGRDLGLEGFLLKRSDAPYLPGRRTESWIKVKLIRRREFVVGGWLEGQKSREGSLGSLALGVWDGPNLRFVGMAGSGLTGADIDAFARARPDLERADSPFGSGQVPPKVRFLEPVLVAEVIFSEVTAAGTLRHPRLAGFRTDIDADEVVVDDELRPGQ